MDNLGTNKIRHAENDPAKADAFPGFFYQKCIYIANKLPMELMNSLKIVLVIFRRFRLGHLIFNANRSLQ